ncbi:MAG: DUF5654 family protein [Minisyncoccia bacterium]
MPKENIEKVKKEFKEIKKEFKRQTTSLFLNGLSFVAALAWNEAIKSLFEYLFPKRSEVIGKFFYAILITLIIVFVSLQLRKILKEESLEN